MIMGPDTFWLPWPTDSPRLTRHSFLAHSANIPWYLVHVQAPARRGSGRELSQTCTLLCVCQGVQRACHLDVPGSGRRAQWSGHRLWWSWTDPGQRPVPIHLVGSWEGSIHPSLHPSLHHSISTPPPFHKYLLSTAMCQTVF